MKTKARKNHKQGKKLNQNRSQKNGPRYWMAMGTMGALVAYTALASKEVTVCFAQNNPSAQLPQKNLNGALPVFHFNIPGGTIGTALVEFQKISGVEALVSNDSIGSLYTPGVTGVFTAEQALKGLLVGTSITYRFISPQSVILEIQVPMESLEVTGPITTLNSPKFPEPLREVPETITVIPSAVIQEQGATTLRDVLRNVPGLTIVAGEGGTPAGDNLTLRGFNARNDVFVDGVRDLSPQVRDSFNLEQVEVYKGPGSAYTGRGFAGGTINLVSKAPSLNSFYGGILNAGSDKMWRGTLDITQPLNGLGWETGALRVNIMGQDAKFPGRDVVENQRWGISPSFAFGLNTQNRFTLTYLHLEQDNLSDYGIPWVPVTNNVLVEYRDRPAPVPRDTFYGYRSRDKEHLDSDLGTAKFEHDFNTALSLRTQLRYGYGTRDSMATPPRFASNDSTVINREMRSWLTEDQIWDSQTDFLNRFSTGGLDHTVTTGMELTYETNIRKTRTAPNSPTTLLNPNPDDVYTGVITLSPIVGDLTGKSFGAYVIDNVNLGERWELLGALRWDYFDAGGINTLGVPVERIDRMLSYRAGIIYKPKAYGSIYTAYGTSLTPSLDGLSYNAANTAIGPEKTYTFEIGTKWDLLQDRLSLTSALFRVDKVDARTPGLSPEDPPQVLDGNQRVDGVELGAGGSLSRKWKVSAAYTFLQSEILESNVPAEVGKQIQNTPKNSWSFWTTYQLPFRISVGGGANYVSQRYGNNINTRIVDSYWLIDAMASFQVTRFIDLRLNLYNLSDEYYFDRLGGGHIIPGAARSVVFSAGFGN